MMIYCGAILMISVMPIAMILSIPFVSVPYDRFPHLTLQRRWNLNINISSCMFPNGLIAGTNIYAVKIKS